MKRLLKFALLLFASSVAKSETMKKEGVEIKKATFFRFEFEMPVVILFVFGQEYFGRTIDRF